MNAFRLITALIFTASLTAVQADVIIGVDINNFFTDATGKTATNGNITQTARSGTNATYQITNVDLTSLGGTANETIDFTIDFSGSSANLGYKSWGDASVGGGNTSAGETFSAEFGTISSSYGGAEFVGFTSVFVAAYTEGENVTVHHDGGNIATSGPGTDFAVPSSSFVGFTVDTGSGDVNIGGFDLQVSVAAIPEPSTLVLSMLAFCVIAGVRRLRQRA